MMTSNWANSYWGLSWWVDPVSGLSLSKLFVNYSLNKILIESIIIKQMFMTDAFAIYFHI